ncbi:MAG: glycosyltransferase family 4 protein [Candidatus Latescibacterota bacterium]|nr:MAG: glycosyltransferase family 4 protein [Candidatus Latescibacterota bacterium]
MPQSLFENLDVGVLVPSIGVFGGVRRFIEIGNELVNRGHRYVLYHPTGEPPNWLPFSGETKPLSELDRSRHQVLICNDPPLLEKFEKASAELKLFYFVLENIKNERRIARHRGWHLLANSTGMHDRLRRKYRVPVHKVIGGIDLDTFCPRPAGARGKPDRTDLDHYRILTFGRLSRQKKGVPIVVSAVRAVARSRPVITGKPVKLVVFDALGRGHEQDPRTGIESLARSVPVEFHLDLPQSDLASLYRSCDLFVNAEKRAGWANTVAEAMACGLPVVCTRSGTRDLAAHGTTAWVVRWRHQFFVSRAIRTLYRDPALGGRLSGGALERVRRFSWPHVVDQLEDVIRRQLASSG